MLQTSKEYYNLIKEKEGLCQEVKLSLFAYLSSNSYPTDIINSIVDEQFIATNPKYYLYYPYLFSEYFQINDKETLNLLSISGFLYYRAIILIDDIFDNDNIGNKFQSFVIANICQEETIKILSSFFPQNSDFWKIWNKRKFEYAKAYKLDKTLKEIVDYKEYESLADYKSAFGKIAIDCLFYLSDKKFKSEYSTLLESHKLFYTAFQIIDDIMDYAEDIKNDQFNISKHELIKYLASENDIISNYTVDEQKKLIYLKGTSEYLYVKAIEYLNRALILQNETKSIGGNLWVSEIANLYNTSVIHNLNIEGFIKNHETKIKFSHILNSNVGFKTNIVKAIDFIEQSQLSNGSWNDIFNDAGVSDVWTTSFVSFSVNKVISKNHLNLSSKFIKQNNTVDNLWGYNKVWIKDADSSSFALLALKDQKDIQKSFDEWLSFQKNDGGFTTYNDKNILLSSLNSSNVSNVDGWLQSHFCVSAVAFLVFVEFNKLETTNFKNLRDYLMKRLRTKNNSLSYWWTEDIYSLYYILLGAIKVNDLQLIGMVEKRVLECFEFKSFNNFFKSYLLRTICLSDNLYNNHSNLIHDLAKQISKNQFSDGSWEEGYSLRMPHPSVLWPNEENIDWKQSNTGTNIIVKDYGRIFTSVSCLMALKSYESRI